MEKPQKPEEPKDSPKEAEAAAGPDEKQLSSEEKRIIELEMRLEKMEAKFDFFDTIRKGFEEKFSHYSEQIGELRAMLVEREKFFKEVEMTSKRLQLTLDVLNSEDLQNHMKKTDKGMEENKARIHRLEEVFESSSKELKELRYLLDRLKPLDMTLKIADDIDKKMRLIEEKRKQSEGYVGKAEKIYVEMKGAVTEMGTLRAEVEKLTNIVKEVAKMSTETRISLQKLRKEPIDEKGSEKGVDTFFKVPAITVGQVLSNPQGFVGKMIKINKCLVTEVSAGEYTVGDNTGVMGGYSTSGIGGWGDIQGIVRTKDGKVFIEF